MRKPMLYYKWVMMSGVVMTTACIYGLLAYCFLELCSLAVCNTGQSAERRAVLFLLTETLVCAILSVQTVVTVLMLPQITGRVNSQSQMMEDSRHGLRSAFEESTLGAWIYTAGLGFCCRSLYRCRSVVGTQYEKAKHGCPDCTWAFSEHIDRYAS